MTTSNLGPVRRALLQRRIRLLVTATITYNVIETAVAITAGTIASSAALIGSAWTRSWKWPRRPRWLGSLRQRP